MYRLLISTVLLLSVVTCTPIDTPPHNGEGLAGPNIKTLDRKSFQANFVLNLPFDGTIHESNGWYLLSGYNENQDRHALISLSRTEELPTLHTFCLSADSTGKVWAIRFTGTPENPLCELTPKGWVTHTMLAKEGLLGIVKVTESRLWLSTRRGIIVWNTQTKQIEQRADLPSFSRYFPSLRAVSLVDGALVVYKNVINSADVDRFALDNLVSSSKRRKARIWAAYEDPHGIIWIVAGDANWDGVLLRYDGQRLKRVSIVPYHYLDSGRSVSGLILDKSGNLWINVDSYTYIYLKEGKWAVPQIRPTGPDEYRSYYIVRGLNNSVLFNDEGKLHQVQ